MPDTRPVARTDDQDEVDALVTLMARIGWCRSASFSPDGQRIAFVSDLSGVSQLWTVATTGGWPERLTLLDDPVGGAAWSPDGALIAFTVAPGGGMNEQVHVIRPDGDGLRRLTDGGSETNRLSAWTHDGAALAVTSNRRTPATMDAYLVDPRTGIWRYVADTRGTGGILDISRDGRRAILSRRAYRGDDDLYLLDLESGAETLLTPHNPPALHGGGHFSPDGNTLYLSSNEDRDLSAFARIRLAEDGSPGPVEVIAERGDAELDGFDLSDDGTTGLLAWNVAGRTELSYLDLSSLTVEPGPALPAELGGGGFSRDGRLLALTVSGAASTMDIWVHDRATGETRQVTHSPHAGVDLAALVQPELVRFPAHDGLELSGWLYRPRGREGLGPLVLSFHGGPEGQERPALNATYQALLSQGIAVLAPNVRGSSGSGKRFVNLDNGALRFDAIRDIASCAEFAVRRGGVDPRRLGIMGGSYGGYMTMAGVTEYPQMFAAAANLFGVVNFETFFEHTEPWMAAISKVEYGDPDTEVDLLRSLSPVHRIDRVVTPTIVLHGANDTNVPVVEAEQVVESLTRRGVPVEYVLFPDEGHGFRKATNRVTATLAIVRWFRRHLARE